MRVGRDASLVAGYVVQGAAMGVGAFLGATLVTIALALLARHVPLALAILPRPPGPTGSTGLTGAP